VIAVNGASKLVDADHVYSKHPERFITYRWLEAQRFRFGDVTVHADVKAASRPDCVDEWWDGIWGGGGSAWDARKLAVRLGYEAVILCGVPMIAGPHVPQVQLGSFMHREDIVKEFRDQIEADAKWHKGATSMSGWTRDLLGSP
jgi:hypothetical protein